MKLSTTKLKDKLTDVERDSQLIEKLTIKAPNFQSASFRIVGTAPYMQQKFRAKAIAKMRDAMVTGKKMASSKREKRDFEQEYEEATYKGRTGIRGIPASAFRTAAVSACRLVGFKMTVAKLAIFIEADDYDFEDRTPLIEIHGERYKTIEPVRNATGGCDLRARPCWDEWYADVRIRWDGDIFNATDILNLLCRIGLQVGIGEGRADSKSSAGIGYGSFDVETANV